VQLRLTDPPHTSIQRVHAVVNPASGRVAPGATERLAALVSGFGLALRVTELEPGRCEAMVRAVVDEDPDLVIVLGGDGTARLVAETCGPSGPVVAPLSGGTMNKLGRALYGPRPWRAALSEALEARTTRWVSGGEVDGRGFYCRAVLGSPALWARPREEIRARNLARAWRRAVVASRRAFSGRLYCEFDEIPARAFALGLICPTVSRAGADQAALEAAVLDLPDAKAGVRLAMKNLFGDWRSDPDVTVLGCRQGRTSAEEPIPAMLDGEFVRLGREVEIRFRPRAFRALAPPPESVVRSGVAPDLARRRA
jgi:diacylglycerol kinase family enzyme